MARGGVYRTDVEKARKELLSKGKSPTVEAIRFILGGGSNTTILRHLQEINAETASEDRPKPAISDALGETVQRLAEQLQGEADQRIAQIQAASDAAIADSRARADQAHQERLTLATQLQRAEVALQAEQSAHTESQRMVAEASMRNRELDERVAGLTIRVTEHEAHSQSLEEKHRHAREALDHYRTSVKEQREQEQRRHEHQVQELQVSLRQANDAVAAKNHELLQLNRDNARLAEQVAQNDKELRQLRAEARQQKHELDELQPIAVAHQVLQSRWVAEQQAGEEQRKQFTAIQAELGREREARQLAETAAAKATARLEAIEETLKTLATIPT